MRSGPGRAGRRLGDNTGMERVQIHITGIVQGVGFRPFVYREAVARGLLGWVKNAADGVHVEAQGARAALDSFVCALRACAPAAARVDRVDVCWLGEDADACATAASTQAAVGGSGDAPCDDPAGACDAFRIVASAEDGPRTTLVSPDIATCPDCLRELFDPADRRYHYPFINCTNCGPRYTIIRSLPYDRAATSMADFPMCPSCAAEYADPLDRRFHAQPDACFSCGPHLTWRERGGAAEGEDLGEAGAGTGTDTGTPRGPHPATPAVGRTREESDAIIARCAELLASGGIVAIKGLGGFHLACNAADDTTVRELRRRKRRSNKPLAIMVPNVATAERWCVVDDAERALLEGTVRPIVLLRRRDTERHNVAEPAGTAGQTKQVTQPHGALADSASSTTLAPSVAFDLTEVGVMLPYTPLQHLLLAACAERGVGALVMTSGNVSEEPIETDDDLAWQHLVEGGLADALLGNNRAILARFDDSVVRVVDGAPRLVRRARGYAPRPLELPRVARDAETAKASEHPVLGSSGCTSSPATPPAILACGPEQKATLALTREHPDGTAECLLSQHIGDLENAETLDAWQECRTHLQEIFDVQPAALACDLHPGYLASQWARAEAERSGLPLVEVQHHHAHIASVLAEAAARGEIAPDAAVVGLALDGTGAGTDGTVWGGEVLVASLASCRRAAHLRTWRLPGGAAAVRDARRNAFGLLSAHGLLDHPGAATLVESLTKTERTLLQTMVERGINSPITSSMGRFLDAVAAIIGVCPRATYEGEPAIELEAAATRAASQKMAETGAEGRSQAAEMQRETLSGTSQPPETPEIIDLSPLLVALLDGMAQGDDPECLALLVHQAVAETLVDAVARIARREGIDTVALSGGVFLNRLLLTQVERGLAAYGLRVLIPQNVPVNDGCIAYGQAAVARARLTRA